MDKETFGCIFVAVFFLVFVPIGFFTLWWAFNTISPLFGGPVLTLWPAIALYVLLIFIGNIFGNSSKS